ncbi:response regulator transcription factor [Variovorax sp. DT-64]|uniref:response regulator transcription factor n=1 Tax=Variovorax sp. DT-64 TaxID=3396160 RepID=UPI003F1C7E90
MTPAERAIVNLLVQGWTNKEIGRQLGKSDQTIKGQLKALMRRASVRNNYAAGPVLAIVLLILLMAFLRRKTTGW